MSSPVWTKVETTGAGEAARTLPGILVVSKTILHHLAVRVSDRHMTARARLGGGRILVFAPHSRTRFDSSCRTNRIRGHYFNLVNFVASCFTLTSDAEGDRAQTPYGHPGLGLVRMA